MKKIRKIEEQLKDENEMELKRNWIWNSCC